MSFIPFVREETHRGDREMSVYSRLLLDRIIFLGTPIDDIVANNVIAQLLFLEGQDPEKDIYIYLNSPGGHVTAGLAIYDTMQYVAPDVATICMGQAASMGALLLCAGAHGKRKALPHSRVLIHQPHGGAQGQASDIEIHAREILRLRQQTNEIIAKHTGKDIEQVAMDTDRDKILSPHDALAYGLIDEVVELESSASDDEETE